MGTQEGVSRFLRKPLPFVNYQQEPGNPNSLHDNNIRSVQGDSQGFLWIGTERGLNRLDRKTGQVTSYRHDPKNPHSLSDGRVCCNPRRPGRELWVATSGGGLNRFDPASAAIRHLPARPEGPWQPEQ